jgi:hypothetical protein
VLNLSIQAPLGDLSPYGYELYALAKYLAEARSPTSLDGTACAKVGDLVCCVRGDLFCVNGGSVGTGDLCEWSIRLQQLKTCEWSRRHSLSCITAKPELHHPRISIVCL